MERPRLLCVVLFIDILILLFSLLWLSFGTSGISFYSNYHFRSLEQSLANYHWFRHSRLEVITSSSFTSEFVVTERPHVSRNKAIVSNINPIDYDPRQYFTNRTGFVMALHYSDQMTGSSWNVITLQCWAASIVTKYPRQSLFVVEPFLHLGSVLGATLEPDTSNYSWAICENEVRLRDVFNIKQWSKEVHKKRKYAPLSSWDYFLKHAPRKMILVGRECRGKQNCMECQHWYDPQRFYESAVVFAEKHGFTIVHTACFGNKDIDAKEFQLKVYGEYSPGDVTVVFNHWGGIEHGTGYDYRVPITNMRRCERGANTVGIGASTNIDLDAKKYIEQFMPTEKGYIAVMVRWEYHAINTKMVNMDSTKQHMKLMQCINDIVNKVESLKRKLKTDSVFLAMDYGKYGSLTLKKSTILEVQAKAAIKLHETLYGNTSTIEEWEDSFDSVTQFGAPGYIAVLQRYIAANAMALILAGGGAFQRYAERLHKTFHPYKHIIKHAC